MKHEQKQAIQQAYCQFLMSSHTNFTQTYLAEHHPEWSHDQINRFLRQETVRPAEVWRQVHSQIVASPDGYLLFDDTVAEKPHAHQIALVRRQWSGNKKRVVKGIGLVTCVYVNPETEQYWEIDFRLYDPDRDGKSKHDHVREMLLHTIYSKQLPFGFVLMDSWYATRKLMRLVEEQDRVFYCPIKINRQVDDSDGQQKHRRVDALDWTEEEMQSGKWVHLKDFPKGHRLKLFRLVLSTKRTEYIVTNDYPQTDVDDTKKQVAVRWKVEQFHREAKQVTGLEACQARTQRAQRNHIGCAILAWVQLTSYAHKLGSNVYHLKQGLLDDYMRKELENPSLLFGLAA